ncbi:MAG: hypothetical protein NXI04_05210 [Planctomycetaceae bacterium]|nr:hypothetical protein [Planctomycetaceae bacterium]
MAVKIRYTFRPNLLQSPKTVVSGHDGLELRNKTGRILRQIPWADVVRLQQFQYAMARTENGTSVPLLAFRVRPRRGRPIMFLSGSWMGPGAGRTQFADSSAPFLQLVTDVKHRVANIRPEAELVTGDRGYSLMFMGLAALIASITVVVGLAFLSSDRIDQDGWRILLLLAGLALFVAPLTWHAARSFQPASTTVAADLTEDHLAG